MEILATKLGGMLFPATDEDKVELRKLPQYQTVKVKLVRQSRRSIDHNGLYWSGLLGLAAQYWEPEAGTMSPNEQGIINSFCKFITRNTAIESGPMKIVSDTFIAQLKTSRAKNHPIEVADDKKKAAIHLWVKEEVGLYHLVATPGGWKKVIGSINFNGMSQEKFNEFYKEAFNCIWRFILSREFESEEEAQQVINELSSMG